MRWSDKSDDDNLKALLRGEGGGPLGAALADLRENAPEASEALRERVRTTAAGEERKWTPEKRPPFYRRYRISFAHVGIAVAAFVVLTVAMNGIVALGNGDEGPSRLFAGPQQPPDAVERAQSEDARNPWADPDESPEAAPLMPRRSALPPPPAAEGGAKGPSPLPPGKQRAQDYQARIRLHVGDHDDLSQSVQTAIRTTRNLGGYVTYVDYGTSGSKDGAAELRVRVPVGRVQTAIARFSELGTILEQKTEIRDLQAQIDRITRDIQRRRDRIAKLEAELRNPTLTEAERHRLEARLVQAKRGLANATRARTGFIRQSSFAKLDLAFTTGKSDEPAPPPGELRRTLDDALGILGAELGVLLYILIAGAPFIVLAVLAWLGARALKRGANARILERA
jgi:Domain of unknown function (DUF4349)